MNIIVLCGGLSNERDVSLVSGNQILIFAQTDQLQLLHHLIGTACEQLLQQTMVGFLCFL